MQTIGKIYTDFPEKFGIPRQSGLVDGLESRIVFDPPYNQKEAFNGLNDFEYIWILFKFHKVSQHNFKATVKPPKLGGNTPVGVFATRSPFRPNGIGLSSVKLSRIEYTVNEGTVLYVTGADLVDGTPIIDIKPYLPYTDCHEGAKAGFSDALRDYKLNIIYSKEITDEMLNLIPEHKKPSLEKLLSEDPRPGYLTDSNETFGLSFSGLNIRFHVIDKTLTVTEITKLNS